MLKLCYHQRFFCDLFWLFWASIFNVSYFYLCLAVCYRFVLLDAVLGKSPSEKDSNRIIMKVTIYGPNCSFRKIQQSGRRVLPAASFRSRLSAAVSRSVFVSAQQLLISWSVCFLLILGGEKPLQHTASFGMHPVFTMMHRLSPAASASESKLNTHTLRDGSVEYRRFVAYNLTIIFPSESF